MKKYQKVFDDWETEDGFVPVIIPWYTEYDQITIDKIVLDSSTVATLVWRTDFDWLQYYSTPENEVKK